MAQAARLNLRMQKELKLLLTDPPHGASFPHLSPTSDLSSFSLTAIDAQIEGPEGTVYEKGIFKIKIQIPERYPFQPPIVTFATPIYHPNIDTGGRICLDILNLPPKGAWQPSLNISTVLTSIGLLLSEPNPDDGLMCEASKEYKYNKQVFDQKARSMTEKYARSDASPDNGRSQILQDSSMTEDKAPELVKIDMHKNALGIKKISGISNKLSMDASGSNTRQSDAGMKDVRSNESPDHDIRQVITDLGMTEDRAQESVKTDMHEYAVGVKNLSGISKKLSLDSSESNTRQNDVGMKNVKSSESQDHDKCQVITDLGMTEDDAQAVPKTDIQEHTVGLKNVPGISRKLSLNGSGSKTNENDVRTKKLSGIGRKLSLNASRSNTTDADLGIKKPSVTSKKLSLDALASKTREGDMVMNELTSNTLSGPSQTQKPKQDSKDMRFDHSKNHVSTMINSDHDQHNKLPAICSKKLSISANTQPVVSNSTNKSYEPMPLDPQKENLLFKPEVKAQTDPEVQKKPIEKSCINNPKRKKLGLTGKRPAFGFLGLAQNRDNGNKGNRDSGGDNISNAPQTNQCYKGKPRENGVNSSGLKLSRKPLQVLEEKHKNHNMNVSVNTEVLNSSASKVVGVKCNDKDGLEQVEGLCDSEEVIVLDSEDSEEESMSKSSCRRLIGRKRLLGKC
ncbi:uncharacterized protein [Rutidosis leptorrhynchoides]|uniref:uncharacterized protein n=1 Tax=Rutidosis leptorrhynchoides TaxID=125765 RepID=UPI003A9A1FBB